MPSTIPSGPNVTKRKKNILDTSLPNKSDKHKDDPEYLEWLRKKEQAEFQKQQEIDAKKRKAEKKNLEFFTTTPQDKQYEAYLKEKEAAEAAQAPPVEEAPLPPPGEATPEDKGRTEWSGDIVVDENKEKTAQEATDLDRAQIEAMKAGGMLWQDRQAAAAEGQQLAGQVGQFGQLGVSPTGLDFEEASRVALVDALPRALQFAAGGAALGAAGGALPGAIIGAIGGFAAGFISSIVSDFKSQRRDMNENPRVVLQDGKTNIQDLATEIANNPVNRGVLISQVNEQLALINQAYRQVKLDTIKDPLMFERSADLLADFEFFYSNGGERDILMQEVIAALGVQLDPEYIMRYREMADRRNLL